MPYNAKAIANELLDIAARAGGSISPLKLQKLVYYSHGWHLGVNHTPLIDESVQAWKFGPVIPSLYHEFKGYGNSEITSKATDIYGRRVALEQYAGNHAYTREFLEWAWKRYGGYTPEQLSSMTHAAGTPWRITWDNMGSYKIMGQSISNDLIKRHFAEQIATAAKG